ncbi:hypothetical protein A2U01_0055226, partial [Trifolium medium]|nr:hypothetical protein [Trifolium medium]
MPQMSQLSDDEADSNDEIEAPVKSNVETDAEASEVAKQIPPRIQECELADDSGVNTEGELVQYALLVNEPVTESEVTDVGMVSCFLRNKFLRTPRGLMLHQKKYAGEVLRILNMVESKPEME